MQLIRDLLTFVIFLAVWSSIWFGANVLLPSVGFVQLVVNLFFLFGVFLITGGMVGLTYPRTYLKSAAIFVLAILVVIITRSLLVSYA